MRGLFVLAFGLASFAAAFAEPFTHLPIDLALVREIIPLGNLNPPDHTLPTDHAYLVLRDPRGRHEVRAPAAGRIRFVIYPGPDCGIEVDSGSGRRWRLGHLALDPGIGMGSHLAAGQRVGVTSGRSAALDLYATDLGSRLVFVRPERYPDTTLHAVSPLVWFAPPLRERLLPLVARKGEDKHGKIAFDVPGRLAGNWFLEGLAVKDSLYRDAWPKHLAFVRDVREPDQVRIAIGGVLALQGTFAVQEGATDPAAVSPASGAVLYRLFPVRGPRREPVGWLRVQMLGEERIRIEAFPGAAEAPAAFTAAARVYVR